MGFFSRKTKGVCPECNSVIEDVNDNFCANCGWKISKFKAIHTKEKLKSEVKQDRQNLNDVNVIDLAMENLKKNGVRKEDTLEYAIDSGKTTHKAPLTDKERRELRKTEVQRSSFATGKEVTRIYIKESLKDYADFLGNNYEEFENFMIDEYNQGKGSRITLKLLKSKFDLPPKEAQTIYVFVRRKALMLSDWASSKEKGATYFTIYSPHNDKYDGQKLSMDDFEKYIPFMIENNAVPRFHK